MNLCGYVQIFVGMMLPRTRSMGSPGTGNTGSHEVPDVGAGNQTWIPWRATTCFNHRIISPGPGEPSFQVLDQSL